MAMVGRRGRPTECCRGNIHLVRPKRIRDNSIEMSLNKIACEHGSKIKLAQDWFSDRIQH
jgi:hypothetical protein